MSTLRNAIDHMGGQSATARRFNTTVQVVHNWLSRGRIPAAYAPLIEDATNGAFTANQLRPDIPWDVVRRRSGGVDSTQ